jgi:hypothetical protein
MKTMASVTAILLATFCIVVALLCFTELASAQPKEAANWAQAEAGASSRWLCPSEAGGGPFVEIPDTAVSLETDGGPVLVLAFINVVSNGEFTMRPVVDGAANPDEDVTWLAPSTVLDAINLHKIYALPPGMHRIALEVSCALTVYVAGRRLSAYELPLVKAK